MSLKDLKKKKDNARDYGAVDMVGTRMISTKHQFHSLFFRSLY